MDGCVWMGSGDGGVWLAECEWGSVDGCVWMGKWR